MIRAAAFGAALLSGALLGGAEAGAQASDAETAYRAGDYAEARQLWTKAAEAGDPDAAMGLAALADLGLGQPRDPVLAFRYYLAAADAGHPDGQFNVGVMLDAGAVGEADPAAAAVWYARAAANGSPRAAYNLGMSYARGTGVPRNADLADRWLAVAAEEVAAAATARTRLEDADPGPLTAPSARGGYRVGARADFVWTSGPVSASPTFRLQVWDAGAGRPGPMLSSPFSAASLDVSERPLAWRVLRLSEDGETYAASDWTALDPGAREPTGLLRIDVPEGDADALRLAEAIRDGARTAGIGAWIETTADPADGTDIAYACDTDRGAAEAITAILPATTVLRRDPALEPGLVRIRLSGGIAASG